ncbi:MAG TPA: CcmD family protein [Candidatus Thermoplasmatota archaeon]|nr:CcmD family protein [Candidatus Thermoplasmatota archaeon]
MTDLQSFTAAFLVVWGALAAYLLWLHAKLRRLQR